MMRGQTLLVSLMLCVGQAHAVEPQFNSVGVIFDAVGGGQGSLLSTYRPSGYAPGTWSASTFVGIGDDVLRVNTADGQAATAIDEVMSLVATGSYDLSERIRVHASLPMHAVVRSDGEVNGAALGDLRMATHVVLVPQTAGDLDVSLGVVPFIDVPAGGGDQLLGEGTLGGGVKLTATGEWAGLYPTVNVGYHGVARSQTDDFDAGSRWTGALGVAWQQGAFGLTTEAHKQLRAGGSDALGPGAAEWISSASWRSDNGLRWIGGGAVGLASGVGVPAYRLFVGVQTSLGGNTAASSAPMQVVEAATVVDGTDAEVAPELANQHPDGIATPPSVLPVWAVPRQL